MRRILAIAALVAGTAVSGPVAALQSTLLPQSFDTPVFLTAPAGDSRLFIVEKAGRIQMLDNGVLSTYLDLSGQVNSAGERGLLGLAFDPDFGNNHRFYVNYIGIDFDTKVSAFTAPSASAASVDIATGQTVLSIAQPAGRDNHKAGWIGFRSTDPGQLYVATGDGGSGDDPDNLAQDLGSNLGKILRVTPSAGGGYTVPQDNPFVGVAGNDEIWAYGLRNPYRNSFDRLNGDFWIADVGQNAREEVNLELNGAAGGVNYGWRAREGSVDNPAVPDAKPVGAVEPFFEYAHGTYGQSVIGGYVYRGNAEPGLDGSYFFGDFVSGRIFTLRTGAGGAIDVTERTAELGTPFGAFQLSSFGEDGLGNLYAMGINGQVVLIAAAVPEPSTWAILLAGTVLLGAFAARRGRRRM
ncbi:PQQ-dependent sugar dehydrogenase [Comamonadaceae bacterium G21597-S1]|nr:PQQ-dependent sugar dehydrogenase [Comamonadaceae bacterium G21597-S1]